MAEMRPELLARFGDGPDALEWARWHVQDKIDWLNEAASLPHAGPGFIGLATWCAGFMRDTLIGTPGERGTHGAFDARFAAADTTAELEPGTLRDSGDLPERPPLFTTRRLFQALEGRVERPERARAAGTPRADPFWQLSDAARVFAGLPLREEQPDRYRAAIAEALSHLVAVGAVAAGIPFGGIAEHVKAARDVLQRAVGDD